MPMILCLVYIRCCHCREACTMLIYANNNLLDELIFTTPKKYPHTLIGNCVLRLQLHMQYRTALFSVPDIQPSNSYYDT